jgi:hypothetical protein
MAIPQICTICIENINDDHQYLPCAHLYHSKCIDIWLKDNSLCPICKIPVYISSCEQLNLYNSYKKVHDQEYKDDMLYINRVIAMSFNVSSSFESTRIVDSPSYVSMEPYNTNVSYETERVIDSDLNRNINLEEKYSDIPDLVDVPNIGIYYDDDIPDLVDADDAGIPRLSNIPNIGSNMYDVPNIGSNMYDVPNIGIYYDDADDIPDLADDDDIPDLVDAPNIGIYYDNDDIPDLVDVPDLVDAPNIGIYYDTIIPELIRTFRSNIQLNKDDENV